MTLELISKYGKESYIEKNNVIPATNNVFYIPANVSNKKKDFHSMNTTQPPESSYTRHNIVIFLGAGSQV